TRIYFYSLPDLKLAGESKVGHHPDWVTLTPDGKRAYVANAGSNSVSVIDLPTRKEIAQIPVGQVPKRNITAVLPYSLRSNDQRQPGRPLHFFFVSSGSTPQRSLRLALGRQRRVIQVPSRSILVRLRQ